MKKLAEKWRNNAKGWTNFPGFVFSFDYAKKFDVPLLDGLMQVATNEFEAEEQKRAKRYTLLFQNITIKKVYGVINSFTN